MSYDEYRSEGSYQDFVRRTAVCGYGGHVCNNCVKCLKERVDALEKMVTALWYAPGNPGALEARVKK